MMMGEMRRGIGTEMFEQFCANDGKLPSAAMLEPRRNDATRDLQLVLRREDFTHF